MTSCPWEEIDSFGTPGEFQRFVRWIAEQITSGTASEVPVTTRYGGAKTLHERWFTHADSGQTWRLVAPEPPFLGVFERVG